VISVSDPVLCNNPTLFQVFKAIQDGAMEVKVSYAVLLDACQAVLAAKSTPKST
jgi:hypothetical protein